MRLDVRAPLYLKREDQFRKDAESAKADILLSALATKSPAEVAAWIDANVTNLASAKQVLRALAKVVALLVRRL
ncbi:MAG: hypothetical protein KatS3mg082_1747 [Nitrospiraceae bacterium]|nr:MAG: hypothetical protein KatS3mg082_1747 [Nitrospiraceae bacterium]